MHKRIRHAATNGPRELAVDVDGDGTPETVKLVRHGDDAWADVIVDGDTRSTTRLGTWSDGEMLKAMDVDGDGKTDVIRYFTDSDGDHAQVLISDGAAFAEAWNGLIASTPRVAER